MKTKKFATMFIRQYLTVYIFRNKRNHQNCSIQTCKDSEQKTAANSSSHSSSVGVEVLHKKREHSAHLYHKLITINKEMSRLTNSTTFMLNQLIPFHCGKMVTHNIIFLLFLATLFVVLF